MFKVSDLKAYVRGGVVVKSNPGMLKLNATSLIRSHLFDLQLHHHLNPMATEICTATADDLSRLIYVESGVAANALMAFINDCMVNKSTQIVKEVLSTYENLL